MHNEIICKEENYSIKNRSRKVMFYVGNKSWEQEEAQVTNANAYRNGQVM